MAKKCFSLATSAWGVPMPDIRKCLEQSKFFEGISEQSKDTLSSICVFREFKKKEILFHESETGHAVHFLLSGNIQLHKTTPDGKEIVIKVVKPGEVFAEVILFEEDCYPVTATAIALSQVLLIPKAGMYGLLDRPVFRNDFIAMLMRKQRYLSGRVHYLTAFDIEERFRQFLREHYGEQEKIVCRLSKKDIAAAVGTTPESLSRLIMRLKDQGKMNWEQETIELGAAFWE